MNFDKYIEAAGASAAEAARHYQVDLTILLQPHGLLIEVSDDDNDRAAEVVSLGELASYTTPKMLAAAVRAKIDSVVEVIAKRKSK